MNPVAEQSISTLELMRTAWPMFVFIVGIIWGQINVFFKVKELDKDLLASRKDIESRGDVAANELKEFRTREYERDKLNILSAIQKITDVQQANERRMEGKLDAFKSNTDIKLDKLSDQMTSNAIILAEIRGRSYPKRNNKREDEAE